MSTKNQREELSYSIDMLQEFYVVFPDMMRQLTIVHIKFI